MKVARHDPDNFVRRQVELYGSPEDMRVAAKQADPGIVRQYDDAIRVELVLAGGENAPHGRPGAENVEPFGRHRRARKPDRTGLSRVIKVRRPRRAYVLKQLLVGARIGKCRTR